jgi:DNA adenine methylase
VNAKQSVPRYLTPLLKWAGGKRALIADLFQIFPDQFNDFYEPFVGSGIVSLNIQGEHSLHISDINLELINFHLKTRDEPDALFVEAQKFLNTKDEFYRVRAWDREPDWTQKYSELQRAARFVFLNKTCFNGLYRINRKHGYFNVPYASPKKYKPFTLEHLQAVSARLSNADIRCCDFAQIVSSAKEGDLVYFDPPYAPLDGTSSFSGYVGDFGQEEQQRLAETCKFLDSRNVKWVLSNSSIQSIHELFKDFNIMRIQAPRSISCKGDGRKSVEEVLISNFIDTPNIVIEERNEVSATEMGANGFGSSGS